MLCPYLKQTVVHVKNINSYTDKTEQELFCKCSGKDCPFYYAHGERETCMRARSEIQEVLPFQ